MNKLEEIEIKKIKHFNGLNNEGRVVTGNLAERIVRLFGLHPDNYIITTIPDWKEQQRNLLQKLGVMKNMTELIDLDRALKLLTGRYPEDVIIIGCSANNKAWYYLLVIKRSFEVSGIWSKPLWKQQE